MGLRLKNKIYYPRNPGFLSHVLIPILKKYFQESPIFLQVKKKLLIKNSIVAACQPLSFFIFRLCRRKER
ncbi:MAG TPA: hypothetical protein DCK79_01840 [Candidatus Atribacteria bacterium]|nr:hypothetical protein [Candidatus Atribacteria bacterium]